MSNYTCGPKEAAMIGFGLIGSVCTASLVFFGYNMIAQKNGGVSDANVIGSIGCALISAVSTYGLCAMKRITTDGNDSDAAAPLVVASAS